MALMNKIDAINFFNLSIIATLFPFNQPSQRGSNRTTIKAAHPPQYFLEHYIHITVILTNLIYANICKPAIPIPKLVSIAAYAGNNK